MTGGERRAAFREAKKLLGVECWCASFHVERVRFGRNCVGKVEGDESSEYLGESCECGPESVGELGVIDADGPGVVGG